MVFNKKKVILGFLVLFLVLIYFSPIFFKYFGVKDIIDVKTDKYIEKKVSIYGSMFNCGATSFSESLLQTDLDYSIIKPIHDKETDKLGYPLSCYIIQDNSDSILVFSNDLPVKGDLIHLEVKVKGILKKKQLSNTYYIIG